MSDRMVPVQANAASGLTDKTRAPDYRSGPSIPWCGFLPAQFSGAKFLSGHCRASSSDASSLGRMPSIFAHVSAMGSSVGICRTGVSNACDGSDVIRLQFHRCSYGFHACGANSFGAKVHFGLNGWGSAVYFGKISA